MKMTVERSKRTVLNMSTPLMCLMHSGRNPSRMVKSIQKNSVKLCLNLT